MKDVYAERLKDSDSGRNVDMLFAVIFIGIGLSALFLLKSTTLVNESNLVNVFGRTINGYLWVVFIHTLILILLSFGIFMGYISDYLCMIYSYFKMSDLLYMDVVMEELTELEFCYLVKCEDKLKEYVDLNNFIANKKLGLFILSYGLLFIANIKNLYDAVVLYLRFINTDINVARWLSGLIGVEAILCLTFIYVAIYVATIKSAKKEANTK